MTALESGRERAKGVWERLVMKSAGGSDYMVHVAILHPCSTCVQRALEIVAACRGVVSQMFMDRCEADVITRGKYCTASYMFTTFCTATTYISYFVCVG